MLPRILPPLVRALPRATATVPSVRPAAASLLAGRALAVRSRSLFTGAPCAAAAVSSERPDPNSEKFYAPPPPPPPPGSKLGLILFLR